MSTYREQQKGKMHYVLIEKGVPLGTFGNLKKVVEFMEGKDFPSYWTLVRKNENPILAGRFKVFRVFHH